MHGKQFLQAAGLCVLVALALVPTPAAHAQAAKSAPPATAATLTLNFGGVDYLHRWSRAGQNEFTPKGQEDLKRWRDMLTVNVHASVSDGDQLAGVANKVLGNYQAAGKIVRTDSVPRTPARPAEHLIVALLGGPDFIEAAFARVVLVDGVGQVVVYSHRAYGNDRSQQIGSWLQANGPRVEQALMAWRGPKLAALKRLPQATK